MSTFDDPIQYVFLAEQTSPDYQIKNVNPVEDKGLFYVVFDAVLHSFDVMNRNRRIYTAKNVWECILAEKIQSFLSHDSWFGEADHPYEEYANTKLSATRMQTIEMGRISHKITKPNIKGNLLFARIETDSGSKFGVMMAKRILQGMIPCFSCRSIAFLTKQNGKPIVVVKKIITYDWVLYPSHKEAEKTGQKEILIRESADDEIIQESKDIMIPITQLEEFTNEAFSKDETAKLITEWFDDSNFTIQLAKNGKAFHCFDEKHSLCFGFNESTKRRVDDFFSSFKC